MDGAEMRRMTSLEGRLTVLLSTVILLVSVAAAAVAYVQAFKEANDLQDGHLLTTARLAYAATQQMQASFPQSSQEADAEDRIIVERLQATRFPDTLSTQVSPSSLRQMDLAGTSWRAVVLKMGDDQALVVRQSAEARDEIARHSALTAMLPMMALVPVLILIIRGVIRWTLRPVHALAQQLDQVDNAQKVALDPAGVPQEVRPFVASVNAMMQRVYRGQQRQQRFIADAAHELRTPVAALIVQVDNLAALELSEPARDRLSALKDGLSRAKRTLEQLLSLSRAEAAADDMGQATGAQADLALVLGQVLAQLHPLANGKKLDLGVVGELQGILPCTDFDLQTVLTNVLTNAIQMTPSGGQIDISTCLDAQGWSLFVDDTGPGVPTEHAPHVFEPFYKSRNDTAEGTGLGLAIVHAVAMKMGAQVSLGPRPDQRGGCRFTLHLTRHQRRKA